MNGDGVDTDLIQVCAFLYLRHEQEIIPRKWNFLIKKDCNQFALNFNLKKNLEKRM